MDKNLNDSRMVIAQFCDDIRHEIGHKYSLIGCYRGEMIVDNIPAILPKLCVQVQVFSPSDLPFSRLTIRAKVNGDIAAELEMPAPTIDEGLKRKIAASELKRLSVVALLVLSPLSIPDDPCKVRIEAETEDGIIQGSILLIRKRTQEDEPLVL